MDKSSSIFRRIYELGERMREAIDAGRTESFIALARERKVVVDRLQKFETPRKISSDWKAWRNKLAEQHEVLTRAFKSYRQQMSSTIKHVDQLRTAHDRYHDKHDKMERRDGSHRSLSV